jgi:hypothetical protein
MDYKNRLILGSILLILGLISLVFGILLYITTTGFNVLIYIYNEHQFVFVYIVSWILIAWGIALIASGIIFILMGALKHEFKTRKPVAVVIAILVVGLAVTGFFLYVALPPPIHTHARIYESAQVTQVGSDRPVVYSVSSYSNYYSTEYFNVSLSGKTVYSQSLNFRGYKNTSICITPSTFSSSGNYTITNTIVHGSYKKVYSSWINVKPYSPMKITITGPEEATYGYTGVFHATVTGGYGPYSIKWDISGEHEHAFNGNNISFTFGNYYWGYTVEAYVTDKYGVVNSSYITTYIVQNLSASFTDKYAQLDPGMTDTFNGSTFSGFEQSGVGPYYYYWYENGNLFSTSENASFQFNSPGIYNISLEVKDSENQTSIYYQNIKVNPELSLWSYGPYVTSISGTQCVDFWYNVTGGTWCENASGFGHYDVTFYINGQGYIADNSFFSNDIGHYEFQLSQYDLSSGENSFKIVVQDGVGQTSVFSMQIDYSS